MSLSLSGDGTVTGVTAIGDVSSTELGYLDGVTSALQTQINTKADASTQGLVLIDEESFSAVSSVSLNNVFTSTYENYRILISLTATSTDLAFRMRLRAAGSDSATNYFWGGYAVPTTGSSVNYQTGSATQIDLGDVDSSNAEYGGWSIDVLRPQKANRTIFNLQGTNTSGAGLFYGLYLSAVHNQATAYDGFTLLASSGNFTGNVRVYGYKGA